MSKLRSAGRASYHLCRRQPANLDRLLGRRARHAVRIRAAKPRRSEQNHLYFDPGDGRLITVFTSESWQPDARPNPTGIGNVHHIAFMVSRATYTQAAVRGCRSAALPTPARSIEGSCIRSTFASRSGNSWSWPATKFEPPAGKTHADVLREAHNIRLARGAYNIADEHLADAIELLAKSRCPMWEKETRRRHRFRAPDPTSWPRKESA